MSVFLNSLRELHFHLYEYGNSSRLGQSTSNQTPSCIFFQKHSVPTWSGVSVGFQMHRMISETAQSWHKIGNVETTDSNLMFYGLSPMKMRYRFRNTRIPSYPVKLWRSTNKFLEFWFPFNTWFMKLCYIFHMMIHHQSISWIGTS